MILIVDSLRSEAENECRMKVMLYEVQCLKSNEDMILVLAGQFELLCHEPEKFR